MKIFTGCLLVVFCLGLLSPVQVHAQQAGIKGHVIADDGLPADAATVVLLRQRDSSLYHSAITDVKGNYSFDGIATGAYLLMVTKVGYGKAWAGPVQVSGLGVVSVKDIKLNLIASQLKAVGVTAKREVVEVRPDKTVMNLDQNVMAAGTTVYDVLQTAPGVKVQDDKITYKAGQKALIAINGRPVNLPDEQLANLLKSYPNSAVSQIELIQNPSAKYDAASGGGMINIILKKNKDVGFNAAITESAGYGDKYRLGTGINLNWRTKKLNIFANYTFTKSQTPRTWHIDRLVGATNDVTDFNVDYRSVNTLKSNTFNVGADYIINQKQTIGFMVFGNINDNDINKMNTTRIAYNSVPDSMIGTQSNISRNISSINYNVNYKLTPGQGKTVITASFDYLRYHRHSDELLWNGFYDLDGGAYSPPMFFEDFSPATIGVRAEKLDLTQKLSATTTLDAGIKNSQVNSDNTISFLQQINGIYQSLPALSDHFIYREGINQAYLNVNGTYGKKWHLTVGARVEQTTTHALSLNPDRLIDLKYTNLFPNAQLSYDADADNKLNVFYSRTIERPNYQDLNPFVAYVDQFFYSTGNPFLRPQYFSTIEVSDFVKTKYKIALRRVVVDDFYTPIFEQNDSTKVYTTTTANIATRYIYQAELDVPVDVTHWWNINLNVKASVERYDYFSPGAASKSAYDFAVDVPQTFALTPRLKLDVHGYYEAPTYYGIKQYKALYFANAGISYSLFDNTGNIKVAATDIFNTYYDRYSTHYINLDITGQEKSVRRLVLATFTYRFGKRSVKNISRHQMSNSDEQSRLSGSRNEN